MNHVLLLTAILASCMAFTSAFVKLDTETFAREALAAHNSYRIMHHANPLELDQDLTVMAQSIANLRALDDTYLTKLPKYNKQPIGGNVCQTVENATESLGSGASATQSWYDGILDYINGVNSINARDFAQLVWKSTQKVGFGIAKSKVNGHYIAVAFYYPAGNVQSQYEHNVGLVRK